MDILGQVRDRVSGLPRSWKQVLLIAFDTLALLFVMWLSFSARLGAQFTPQPAHLILMLLAPVVAIPVFVRLGLYRAVIRYLPERALWTIIQAMALAARLPGAHIHQTPAGHIGMAAGGKAETALWSPLLQWLTGL